MRKITSTNLADIQVVQLNVTDDKTGEELCSTAYTLQNSTTNKTQLFKLFIKYFENSKGQKVDSLYFVDNKSDWIDLRASEDIDLKAGEFTLIPLGIAMKIWDGYEAHIAPRSSTFKNYGIIQTNSVGVIDNTYCGNNDMWKMPVYATRDTHINFNDRICQFRIVEKQPNILFISVDELENEDRGGFGSTGKQ